MPLLTYYGEFTAPDAVEIALLAVGTILCTMVVIAMLRICPFHIHLWLLLVNLIVCTITFCAFRIASLIIKGALVANDNRALLMKISELLRFIGLYTGWANLFSLLIERLSATIWACKYESIRCVLVPVIFILCTWILVTWLVTAAFYKWISIEIPVYIDLSVNSISLFIFILLFFLQRRMQKQAKHNLSFQQHHSLSEQYQLRENMQCSRLLLPLIVIMSTTSWGSILSFVLERYSDAEVFARIFDFVLCLRAILIPVFITRGNRHLFNHVCRTVGVAYRIRSGKGSMLDERPPEEKSEAYFTYLERAWLRQK
ncbi:hypothetical protein QR680_008823 [Steinernema hermaphroditum]|uniref:Uncharacterized protein n=1 Tax=Steinernema hermaphroditum TaxID=289476 RepID=A0AA39IJG7_9BILA|nr:hypothetical protein QR680_008823 [Steinernema hermaphroditum]